MTFTEVRKAKTLQRIGRIMRTLTDAMPNDVAVKVLQGKVVNSLRV